MGKVLRGQGTTSQWQVASDLSHARWDSQYTVKHDDHHMMTEDERAELFTMREALPKALFANLVTRRAGFRHCRYDDHEQRMAWLRGRSWGLGLNEHSGHRGIQNFMQTLEKWLTEWSSLITLAKTNPEGARIFTRRQSVYHDSHVGIHVGGSGGMPSNYYSSITITPQMQDADLSYFRQLHAKLKPLTDLLSQTANAATSASDHDGNIKRLKHYSEEVERLDGLRDEWVRQDTEALKWVESRPDFIKDGRCSINTSTQSNINNTLYQLLGRQSWIETYEKAKKYQDSYMKRVEDYTPDLTANMIDREAVMKAITAVMEDAVKWATQLEHLSNTPTDGGEEE